MIIHETITYEAFDGTMFNDEIACLNYEFNKLYWNSGIRFINSEGQYLNVDIGTIEDAYDETDCIMIDAKYKKENRAFVTYAINNYGWTLLMDLDVNSDLNKKYKMKMNELIEIKG